MYCGPDQVQAKERHFRSIRAPASLKLFGVQAHLMPMNCTLPFPEHPCSGLIEAFGISIAISAEAPRAFPEHPCSGLIEASGFVFCIVDLCLHFRSIRAPASLKLIRLVSVAKESTPAPFPEHPCSGLIEAKDIPHFRSIRAPASLKQDDRRMRLRPSSPFPEHPCSGLIEAELL